MTSKGTEGPPLTVNPPVIRFNDISAGGESFPSSVVTSCDEIFPMTTVLYVITFSIRNNCATAQRIRVLPPKRSFFSCNFVPSAAVASGLDIRVEVEFQLPSQHPEHESIFEDFLVVAMGSQRVQVPIIASKPLPDVRFLDLLDMGAVVEGASMSKAVRIENHGTAVANISFEKNDKFILSPAQFELGAPGGGSSSLDVQVSFRAKEVGPVRELVQVSAVLTS